MSTTTTKADPIEKELAKLKREHGKAHHDAIGRAKAEQAKADAYQHQADELTAEVESINASWMAGEESTDAATKGNVVAERDRLVILANGRMAAAKAAQAKAERYHGDDALAQIVAAAVSDSIEDAYPAYALALAPGQSVPETDGTAPVVFVYQTKASERSGEGFISGSIYIAASLPKWAAALDERAIEQAAAARGHVVEVGIGAQRATVKRGHEALPLIPEAATDDYRLDSAVYDVFEELGAVKLRERGANARLGNVTEDAGRRQIEVHINTLFAAPGDVAAEAQARHDAAMGYTVRHRDRYAALTSEQENDVREALAALVGRTLAGLGAVASADVGFTDETYTLSGSTGKVEMHRTRLHVSLALVSRTR